MEKNRRFVFRKFVKTWHEPNSEKYRFLIIRNLILLGQCAAPRIGWQIDPFGHSSENARLFKWLGFDGLFFARNDYREKEQMIANKTLDLIWNAGETLPGLSTYNFYYLKLLPNTNNDIVGLVYV